MGAWERSAQARNPFSWVIIYPVGVLLHFSPRNWLAEPSKAWEVEGRKWQTSALPNLLMALGSPEFVFLSHDSNEYRTGKDGREREKIEFERARRYRESRGDPLRIENKQHGLRRNVTPLRTGA